MALESSGRRPGHVPVEHRWLGLDRRTLAPGLAVLALALLWAVALPAIDEAVPQDREVKAGTVLGAGRGVTVVPPVGWNIVSGLDAADAGSGLPSQQVVEVTSGGTTVRVEAVTWDGSLRALLDRGTITAAELDALAGSHRDRRRFVKAAGYRPGPRRRVRHVLHAATDLAEEIARAGGAETPEVAFARQEVLRLRGEAGAAVT